MWTKLLDFVVGPEDLMLHEVVFFRVSRLPVYELSLRKHRRYIAYSTAYNRQILKKIVQIYSVR